jgi:hypothetical protein
MGACKRETMAGWWATFARMQGSDGLSYLAGVLSLFGILVGLPDDGEVLEAALLLSDHLMVIPLVGIRSI